MIKLSRAVVVEGRYDKAALAAVIDAPILQTDGFCIFKDRALRDLLRAYAHTCGLIVLTDSDGAGRVIRAHIQSIVGEGADIVHLYIPQIKGRERRKSTPSKEGFLGVEGMGPEVLSGLFAAYQDSEQREKDPVSRMDLYEWGLFGSPDATLRRERLLRHLDLPADLSVNALLSALNFLYGKAAFEAACVEVLQRDKNE